MHNLKIYLNSILTGSAFTFSWFVDGPLRLLSIMVTIVVGILTAWHMYAKITGQLLDNEIKRKQLNE